MLYAAAKALAARSPAMKDPNWPLLPDIVDVLDISVDIAKAIIKCAVQEGLAQEEGIPTDEDDLEQWVRVQMWAPKYRPLLRPNRSDRTFYLTSIIKLFCSNFDRVYSSSNSECPAACSFRPGL